MKDKLSDFLIEVSKLLLDEGSFKLIFVKAPSDRDLPCYSPFFLDMTEMSISCVKSHSKRQLTEPSVQADFGNHTLAAAQGKTLHEYRIDLLKTFVESFLPYLTIAKCSNFFDYSLTCSPDCLSERDISALFFCLYNMRNVTLYSLQFYSYACAYDIFYVYVQYMCIRTCAYNTHSSRE